MNEWTKQDKYKFKKTNAKTQKIIYFTQKNVNTTSLKIRNQFVSNYLKKEQQLVNEKYNLSVHHKNISNLYLNLSVSYL